jgi:negative regulator of replication initiation
MKTIEVDDELYQLYCQPHAAYWRERIRHFTAHVEIFRRFPACYPVTAKDVVHLTVVEVKPA